MSGHTPGPWDLENGLRVYAPGKAGPLLATIASLPRAPGQDAANARLIAAAPDMLSVLLYVVDNPEFSSEQFDAMARAAIAKATGSAA